MYKSFFTLLRSIVIIVLIFLLNTILFTYRTLPHIIHYTTAMLTNTQITNNTKCDFRPHNPEHSIRGYFGYEVEPQKIQ